MYPACSLQGLLLQTGWAGLSFVAFLPYQVLLSVAPQKMHGPPGFGLFRFGRAAIASASTLLTLQTSGTITTATADGGEAVLPAAVPIQAVDDSDVVVDEADRWKRMDKYVIESFTDDDGVINEMALHYKHRTSFPLHYCVFK